MKKLEKTFTKKGFIYKQISRVGNKAIYTQKRDDSQSVVTRYEVIVIKSHDGYEIAGNKIPAGEVYPSSTQWGTQGWTYVDLQGAENKFKKLKE
jgi:hypothetical protein